MAMAAWASRAQNKVGRKFDSQAAFASGFFQFFHGAPGHGSSSAEFVGNEHVHRGRFNPEELHVGSTKLRMANFMLE